MKNYLLSEDAKILSKIYRQRRRAKKQGLKENYTKDDRVYTMNLFNNICFNCGSTDNLEIDHHKCLNDGFPLSRTNAVVLCRSCNASKHTKKPKEFYSKDKILLLETYNIIT